MTCGTADQSTDIYVTVNTNIASVPEKIKRFFIDCSSYGAFQSTAHVDELVMEYVLFRGFTKVQTLRSIFLLPSTALY